MSGALGRLRGRSLAELGDRGRQFVAALAERTRVLDIGASTAPPAPRALPGDRRWRLPGDPGSARAVAAVLRARAPEACERLVARARDAAAGRFDLLGFRGLSYGEPIDWHRDPVHGRRAPMAHWSRVPFLQADRVGDHKIIWELNRHQHFVTLAQAYHLTGDGAFLGALEAQWRGWLTANPPTIGINWASSLEVAFRAIAWIWALRLTEGTGTPGPGVRAAIDRSLIRHGRHLERFLSTYFSPNTHLTGEALGLLYLATHFEDEPRTRRWAATARRILGEQLPIQLRPDGVYFEQATWYHRYTVDFYLHAMVLADQLGSPFGGGEVALLERAAEVLHALERPDGTTPRIGDDDGGRLLPLDVASPDDFRDTRLLAGVLLERPAFCSGAEHRISALAWALGPEALARLDRWPVVPPGPKARMFPEGGYAVLGSGWDRLADHAVLEAGPHGALSGGHAHADALSIDLSVAGQLVFAECATASYIGPARERFRHTSAHSALLVDGQPSAIPSGPFSWGHRAEARIRTWWSGGAGEYVAAEHDGYRRLAVPATHVRRVVRLRGAYWLVLDTLEGAGTHEVAVGYILAPELSASADDRTLRLTRAGSEWAGAVVATTGSAWALSATELSPAYGITTPGLRAEARGTLAAADVLVTVVATGATSVLTVEELPAGARIRGEGFEDVVLCGHGTTPDGQVASAAEFVWVRRDGAGRAMRCLAIGGAVRVEGVEAVGVAGGAAARAEDHGWRRDD